MCFGQINNYKLRLKANLSTSLYVEVLLLEPYYQFFAVGKKIERVVIVTGTALGKNYIGLIKIIKGLSVLIFTVHVHSVSLSKDHLL